MQIIAKYKVSGAPLIFESTTVDATTLANVDMAALSREHQIVCTARKNQLLVAARLETVAIHRARLETILLDIARRALGPENDEVHLKIEEARRATSATLESFTVKANTLSMKFNEMELIQQLRAGLTTLKDKVYDPEATAEHRKELEKTRNLVSDVLARAEAGVKAWVQGISIAYRGSLATGWRNAKKSDQNKAQRIDLLKFDSDAFITIPHDTWVLWNSLKIVLNNKVEDKMSLRDLIAAAKSAGKSEDVLRALSQLEGIKTVEAQIQMALQSVPGYKLSVKNKDDPGAAEWTDTDRRRSDKYTADFEFVLQTSHKTVRELKSGNLYPLGEIANAGLPLTEADLEVVVESKGFWVKMPERHISMSVVIGEPTYKNAAVEVAHTKNFPTERMQIESYFSPDNKVELKKVATVERQLMSHVQVLSNKYPDMKFD